MSWNLAELESYAHDHCQPYAATFYSPYLIVFRYGAIGLSLLLYGASLATNEIYLLLVGFGLTVDAALNALLQAATDAHPLIDGCGHDGSPSSVAESVTFFTTTLLLYGCIYRRQGRVSWSLALLVAAIQSLTIYALLYYNMTRAEHALLGVVLGQLTACLWHSLMHLFLLQWTLYIFTNVPLLKQLNYKNTFCLYSLATQHDTPA